MIDLKAIRERADAATPGEWFVESVRGHTFDAIKTRHPDYQQKPNGSFVGNTEYATGHSRQNFENDSAFIAHARTDIPALLDEVERLRENVGMWIETHKRECNRLERLISAAPDPAMYRPEELEAAYLKWRQAK